MQVMPYRGNSGIRELWFKSLEIHLLGADVCCKPKGMGLITAGPDPSKEWKAVLPNQHHSTEGMIFQPFLEFLLVRVLP